MVELRNVSKRFGGFTAVDNVTLKVEPGEFLTLLGPSGCGKTTLLRMISGFETPTEGTVWLGGQDVTDVPPYRRNVNQVFQSYALFPHLNVWDNIAFGLRMQKTPASEMETLVKQSVEMVSLGGMEKRKPNELSGGQRQRVALARAIVCKPKVLLLDEPLSALDAKLRHNMQVELKQLQTKLGITFVFVTHDQEEALTMSDRIAVINKGKIEQLGSVGEIYDEPKTTFVANFIGQANILEAVILSRTEEFTDLRVDDTLNLKIRSRSLSPDSGDSILVSIRPEKIHLQRTQPEGLNVFEAVVDQEYFKGATDLLNVKTASGLDLSVLVANESRLQEQFHAGDKIYCQLHPEDIVVVQQDY